MTDELQSITILKYTMDELTAAKREIERRNGTKETMDTAILELIRVYNRTPVAYKERRR